MNVKENLTILNHLPGVNQEMFSLSANKHMAAISCMDKDLIEVIAIYDEYQIPYVKESGIIDFKALCFTKEEALTYAKKNSNVMTIDEYYAERRVA